MQRVARVGSPITLFLALVLFALPFLTVSCDVPGGFGPTGAGGTTTYTGADLALGTSPSADADHVRPEGEREDGDLGVQPFLLIGAVGLLVGCGFALARRFLVSAVAAGAGWVALAVGLLLARSNLVDKVGDQATAPFEAGKSASDYVAIGLGFWLAAGLSAISAVLALVAHRDPARRDRAPTPV